MNDHENPARLFAILARDEPTAVILRRGPSKLVRLILWNTQRDRFTNGQWIKARIHEYRCDLSPSGKFFIYRATRYRRFDPEYGYSWTAVSKPPYFTALALWPTGYGDGGGGLFLDEYSVWLNHHPDSAKPHPEHQPRRLHVETNSTEIGKHRDNYSLRLERDGWKKTLAGNYKEHQGDWLGNPPEVWEKTNSETRDILVMKLKAPGGMSSPEFLLQDPSRNTVQSFQDATWADWDHRQQLVIARHGKLFRYTDDQLALLADFNAQAFSEIEAPDWAKHWG